MSEILNLWNQKLGRMMLTKLGYDADLAENGREAVDKMNEHGYDLIDDNGMLTDWWGFCWMILAEKRGLLITRDARDGNFSFEESLGGVAVELDGDFVQAVADL